ncbi:hypothetical protein [Phyllobacterium sp. YR531]|uniref:hypothetical protein n=1 Tax=Phyllobacterium sp. YR531 TaxID=1144343 RepID=UPI0002E04EB4|nr:hypothetical protein [Phyllobacterium sp. YR531]
MVSAPLYHHGLSGGQASGLATTRMTVPIEDAVEPLAAHLRRHLDARPQAGLYLRLVAAYDIE